MLENPGAVFFAHPVRSRLRAWVCSSCGYTALFAQEPAPLGDAYRAALNQARQDDSRDSDELEGEEPGS